MNKQTLFIRVIATEKNVVRQCGERRAETARREITGSKIAHGCDTSPFSDNRRHAEIQQGGKSAVELSPYIVSEAAKALHFLKAETGPIRYASCGCRERLAEQSMSQTEITGITGRPRDLARHLAHLVRQGFVHGVEETRASLVAIRAG